MFTSVRPFVVRNIRSLLVRPTPVAFTLGCISYLQGSGEKGSSDVGRSAKTQVEDKLTGMDKSAAKAMKGDMQRSNLKNNNADEADDKVSSRLLLYVTASVVLIS